MTKSLRKKHKMYEIFLLTPNPFHLNELKKYRNNLNHIIRGAKSLPNEFKVGSWLTKDSVAIAHNFNTFFTLLPTFSKILEKLVYNWLLKYLELNIVPTSVWFQETLFYLYGHYTSYQWATVYKTKDKSQSTIGIF